MKAVCLIEKYKCNQTNFNVSFKMKTENLHFMLNFSGTSILMNSEIHTIFVLHSSLSEASFSVDVRQMT